MAIPLGWCLLVRLAGLPSPRLDPRPLLRRWRNRCRKLLPAAFLLLLMLAIVGGFVHPPNNYDAMNYRLPRAAHWLMAGQWEWITANNNNLNTRSAGAEWMLAPLIALTRSDRLLFLLNVIHFAFLPGLIFGFLRASGICARTAWSWMWIFPSGYCFALQAGGVANDLPAVVFALAAFDFGLRWKKCREYSHLTMSLLSAALMTAVKPTTLPLLLPYAALCFTMWKPALTLPLRSSLIALCCLLTSFAPTAAINHSKCGDWTGAAAENPLYGSVDPISGLIGNMVNAPLQNIAPPIFPVARAWNVWFAELFPKSLKERLGRCFEPRAANFGVTDIQGEESAGLGIGVFALLATSWIATRRNKKWQANKSHTIPRAIWCLFLISLLIYFSKTGMNTVARHIAPYYVFLAAPLLLGPENAAITRKLWWKTLVCVALSSTIAMAVITPSRPLWPADWLLNSYLKDHHSAVINRARDGYSIYSKRSDALGEMRDALPEHTRVVGLISHASGPESPLWKPYLKRRVVHIRPGDDINALKAEGMSHIIINTKDFLKCRGQTPEEWLAQHHGVVIHQTTIRPLVKEPPSEWWTVELP